MKPPPLEGIIATCTRQDPEERWQSARDIREAMTLPAAAAAPPLRNPWRERAVWIAAVVVLAGILFLAFRVPRPQGSGDVVSFAVYPPDKTAFSAQRNTTVSVPQFALSPDGRSLALVASAAGAASMLWVRPLAEVAARQLSGTENAQDPFWSPDSRWIGFFADGKLKKVPAGGGAVQFVAETAEFRGKDTQRGLCVYVKRLAGDESAVASASPPTSGRAPRGSPAAAQPAYPSA